jgi:hypothetical protein
MASEPSATQVLARLAELRRLYSPERLEDARQRLAAERPRRSEPFEVAVARSLEELRALCELTKYLHRAEPRDPTH